MKKISIFFFLCIVLNSINAQEYEHFKVITLGDGIYAAIHKEGGHAICNAGIVDLGTETLIFDTFMTPQAAEELLLAVAQLGLPQIRFVINSHCHNDHIRGNQVFDESVFIISTEKTRELIETQEPQQIEKEKIYAPQRYHELTVEKASSKDLERNKELQMWLGYYDGMMKSHPILVTTLPFITFKEEFSIRGSSRKVELIEFSDGHTASDMVMYLPEEKILFTGDLLFVDSHPYLGDGNLQHWIKNLETIKEMEAETMIPGHGPAGEASDIDDMIAYINHVNQVIEKGKQEEITLEEVLATPIPDEFQDWSISSFYALNLKILYNQ